MLGVPFYMLHPCTTSERMVSKGLKTFHFHYKQNCVSMIIGIFGTCLIKAALAALDHTDTVESVVPMAKTEKQEIADTEKEMQAQPQEKSHPHQQQAQVCEQADIYPRYLFSWFSMVGPGEGTATILFVRVVYRKFHISYKLQNFY